MGRISEASAESWRLMIMKALIKNIKITERVRKEITKIDELAADIEMNGLINPITVMSVGDDEYRLLAGLRRLKAVERIGYYEIDVNVVAPSDAEMELRIEISENEQREPFTFSEKMNFARLLEEIEKEKALNRKSLGGKGGVEQHTPQGADVKKGETREIVAAKLGMGKTNYDRAKYIADNAPEEIIDELDRGERKIRPTFDELKAKEKAAKASAKAVEEDKPDNTAKISATDAELDADDSDEEPEEKSVKTSKSATPKMSGLLSKADEEAIERNNRFHVLPPEEKIKELQRQLKEARARACKAEADFARLKELRHNDVYHKDGIIENLKARLAAAESRIHELEKMYCPEIAGKGSQSEEVIPLY